MPLPREAWQEDLLEPGPQDLTPGSGPQAAPRGMTEDPDSVQGIESSTDNPSPSTGEVSHHLGWNHHVSHSNSAEILTEFNVYAATLDSPGVEEHDMTSRSSRLIPDYVNLRTSGLMQRIIIQDRYKKEKIITKLFGLLALLVSVAMYATKFIIPETESFAYKLIHHEERSKSSLENLPKFTNPLASNIKSVNYTITFKDSTSQHDRLNFVDGMRK